MTVEHKENSSENALSEFKQQLTELIGKVKNGASISNPYILQSIIESGQYLHDLLSQKHQVKYIKISNKLRSKYAQKLCVVINTNDINLKFSSLAKFKSPEVSQVIIDPKWLKMSHLISKNIKENELLGSEKTIKIILRAGMVLQKSLNKQDLSENGRKRIKTVLTSRFICELVEAEFQREMNNIKTFDDLKNLLFLRGKSVYPEIDIRSEIECINVIFNDWENMWKNESPSDEANAHLLAGNIIIENFSTKLKQLQISDLDNIIKILLHQKVHNEFNF